MTAHGLIDTTEMYLRTVYELEEEGIVPLRARIAERLGQSGPTVSQTVARMERDGLLHVENDRQLALTVAGRSLATQVMRKHRLAERLLTDIIKLPWEEVHIEACRWEHVISESVERRLLELLGHPETCPHGNPIPGLAELGPPEAAAGQPGAAGERAGTAPLTLAEAAADRPGRVRVLRISEQIQSDRDLMLKLRRAGIQPGREVMLMSGEHGVQVAPGEPVRSDASGTAGVTVNPGPAELDVRVASHIFVTPLEHADDGVG